MSKYKGLVGGLIFIAVGVLFVLDAMNILEFELFFDGWWTLFIITPCVSGLFSRGDKTSNVIGILVGVLLLLCCQDVVGFGDFWKLLLPGVIIIIGVRLVIGSFKKKITPETKIHIENGDGTMGRKTAVFSGTDVKYDGKVFHGAELTAVFGSVVCDLRNAIFEGDCTLEATCVFGGIDILVPPYVDVRVESTSVFGGVSSKKNRDGSGKTVTLTVEGVCIFGGVDIK